jgi:tetratricopeptide (TPR) repeat protein
MLPLLRTALCSLAACAHRLAGRAWFRLGNFERARESFERVLELKGDDFVAYVYLGRLAYTLGDYAGWRREYEHARRTSPEQYARLQNPFDLFEPRSAGALREETGERATWRTVKIQQTSGVGGANQGEGLRARSSRARACPDGARVRRYGDDFVSDAERERFRGEPPIAASDLSHLDIDHLIDKIANEPDEPER